MLHAGPVEDKVMQSIYGEVQLPNVFQASEGRSYGEAENWNISDVPPRRTI